jgi:hypothetical protein
MAIHSRYDAREDRMLLSVETGPEKTLRQIWMTRRQWTGLLHQMVAMKFAPLDDPKPPQNQGEPKAKPRAHALPPQPEAKSVQTLKLRKEADGTAKVMFGFDDKDGVGITLKQTGIVDLQRMLEQQAERAGWDPRAALERLDAAEAAAKAMKKAQGGA